MKTAEQVRETFARMAMNDEETAALTAGGHTVGKTHGNGDAGEARPRSGSGGRPRCRASAGPTPSRTGWRAATRSPRASKAPGRRNPTKFDMGYFDLLFGYEWEI